MEFNKNRIYTAVNADELKIGSTVYVSDNMYYLKKCVEESLESSILTSILSEKEPKRFCISNNEKWQLVYLIEPPAEPKYKPFESLNSLSNAVKRHGDNIQTKESKFLANIIGISLSNEIIINDLYGLCILPADELLNDYVFANDGSLCGELVEEKTKCH